MEKEVIERETSSKDPKERCQLPPILGHSEISHFYENIQGHRDMKTDNAINPDNGKPGTKEQNIQKYPYQINSDEERIPNMVVNNSSDLPEIPSKLSKSNANNRTAGVNEAQADPVIYSSKTPHIKIALVGIILLLLLAGVLITYIIILQRKNTECNEKNTECNEKNNKLEIEKIIYDNSKVKCEEQEQNYINNTHLVTSSTTCEELRRNYTEIVNKYILLTEEKEELNKKYYDLEKNHTMLQYKYDILNNSSQINSTSFQSEEKVKALKNTKEENRQAISYIAIKNNELITEKKEVKIAYQLLDEEYKWLQRNCSLFQSKSDSLLSNLERNSMNIKQGLLQMQSSSQLFYSNQWSYFILTNPLPLEFFTATWGDGIDLWKYNTEAGKYSPTKMIEFDKSGRHRRNEDGIYLAPGYYHHNVKIYDMKYYNYPNEKIQLLGIFPHSDRVLECFFKDSVIALCCDGAGYIKEYNVTNPQSIPEATIFNKTTAMSALCSCMQTGDKKYIIAASYSILYILDVKDGTLKYTQKYTKNGGRWTSQIAEVRPNILITVNEETVSLHDIRDPQNMPYPRKLLDIGFHTEVIPLKSNPGDFAIGGKSYKTNLGFIYIQNLEEDLTITTLKYVENIQGAGLRITTIKEMRRGTILFTGGYNTSTRKMMCLWNYSAVPNQDPLCWDDQTPTNIRDIVQVPYQKYYSNITITNLLFHILYIYIY